MIIAPEIRVYTAPHPLADDPAAQSAAKQGSAPVVSPPVLQPLGAVLGDGKYIGRLAQELGMHSAINWSKLPSLQVMPNVTVKPTAVNSAKTPPDPDTPGLFARSKSALGWWTGTTTVVAFAQGVSQAQVAEHVAMLPISQQQAAGATDAIIRTLHSQAGNAVFVAVTVGGAGGALATLLGFKKSAPYVAVGVGIVALVIALLSKEHSPYAHTWKMKPMETIYQASIPPREAVETITEDKDGLRIDYRAIHEDGSRENTVAHINPDGHQHAADLPGVTVVTTSKANTLTSAYAKDGQKVETEVRDLSSDEKTMTVASTHLLPSGQTVKDVTVFERQ